MTLTRRDECRVGDEPGDVEEPQDAGQVGQARWVREERRRRGVELVDRLERARDQPHERDREGDDQGDRQEGPAATGAPAHDVRPEVRDAPAGEAEEERREDQDADDDHHRRSRGIPEPAGGERGLVDVQGRGQRRVIRSATGQHVGRREDLRGADQADDGEIEGDRQEGRPRDVAEARHGAGAIERRGIAQLARHRPERGDVDDDVDPDAPQPDEDHRRHRPGGIAQPGRTLDADRAEQAVDQAEARVEDPAPHQRGRDAGHDHRHEDRRAQDRPAAPHPTEQQRQPEPDDQPGHDRRKAVDDGVGDGRRKARVGDERRRSCRGRPSGARAAAPSRRRRAAAAASERDRPGGRPGRSATGEMRR